MKKHLALAFVGLMACGGGDSGGVSGDIQLFDLTDPEASDVCAELVTADGPPTTIDCGGGVTVTIGDQTEAECIANINATASTCTATVDDLINCFSDTANATDADICANNFPVSCDPVFACE